MTRPVAGQGKTLSRPGPSIATRPGEQGRQARAQLKATRSSACSVRPRPRRCARDPACSLCSQRVCVVHTHCAVNPVLGLGHCFGSLFMDTLHKKKIKK